MSRLTRSICVSLLVAVMTISIPPLRAMAATLTVDDPTDGVQCSGVTFATISAAVLAANPAGGDIILVCDGLYTEQVTINKSLTLQGAAGQTPTVQAPATMADPKAIIRVTGTMVNVTIDGLVISGPGG